MTIFASEKVLFFAIIRSFVDGVDISGITVSRNRYRTCICNCKENNRLTLMPILATRIYGLPRIQILKINLVYLISSVVY